MMDINKQRIAVYGLVLNKFKKEEFLIIKRAAHDTHPNLWELPGGAVDLGEDPQYAVKREILEETGLKTATLYPLTLLNGHSVSDTSMQVVRIVYLCHQTEAGSIKLSPDHHKYRWVAFAKLPPLEYSDIFIETLKKINDYPHLITDR